MTIKEQLAKQGLQTNTIYYQLSPPSLIEQAIIRKEGKLTKTGALLVTNPQYTGRSPKDRFLVKTKTTANLIDWNATNLPMQPCDYEALKTLQQEHLKDKDVFVFDGFIGANKRYRKAVRVVTENAWQSLFIHQLLIRPNSDELDSFKPEILIISTPTLKANPQVHHTNSEAFVVLNFDEKRVLIGSTAYAGEIKKACFTLMNYFLPQQGVCPMHCSANVGEDHTTALFFGLSGTGKTTLSASANRRLVGDDEHGWGEDGIFNFEGGCYAKPIHLRKEHEPQIFGALKFGAVMENAIMDEQRNIDFDDQSITENTRAAYPLDYIDNANDENVVSHPNAILFLTADAFGVLPPVAMLDQNQAAYHYLCGYTSKVAGTERGIEHPTATFSSGFGAPFLPLKAEVYAQLLKKQIARYNPAVYFVNTGWIGGGYGTGKRIALKDTRAIVDAILQGKLKNVPTKKDPVFGFQVPTHCDGVDDRILDPQNTWTDPDAYKAAREALALQFQENIAKLKDIDTQTKNAGPH